MVDPKSLSSKRVSLDGGVIPVVGFMNVTFMLGDGLNWFQLGFYVLLIWGGASQFDSPFFLNNIFQYRVEIATYFKVSGLSACLLWHLICQKHRLFEFDHDLPKTLRTHVFYPRSREVHHLHGRRDEQFERIPQLVDRNAPDKIQQSLGDFLFCFLSFFVRERDAT